MATGSGETPSIGWQFLMQDCNEGHIRRRRYYGIKKHQPDENQLSPKKTRNEWRRVTTGFFQVSRVC